MHSITFKCERYQTTYKLCQYVVYNDDPLIPTALQPDYLQPAGETNESICERGCQYFSLRIH